MPNWLKLSGAVLAALVVTACASPVFSGGRAWSDGWRDGVVSEVREQARWNASVCRKAVPPDARYVTVNYRMNGKPKWLTIPMATSDAFSKGTKVLVNVNTCEVAPV